MQALEAHGKAPLRGRAWIVALGVVLLVVVVGVLVFNSGPANPRANGTGGGSGGGSTTTAVEVHHVAPIVVDSTAPAAGATNVATNTDLEVTFSSPVTLGPDQPTLSPPVTGSWDQPSPTTIRFTPSEPFIPSQTEVLTIGGGAKGPTGTHGGRLASTATVQFTIAEGDTLRLQELLAQLDYLPLSFTPSGGPPPPADTAMPQLGNFAWRWSTLPVNLTSLWAQGSPNEITKAAVMSFENQSNLEADGLAGPEVWSALLHDAATQTGNTRDYVYVLVNKVQPENLTLYDNGVPKFTGVPVNTGAPGADTTDGTFAVFEHVVSSEMKGTNPDGTKYDDPNVPWASYFNGGDALHGFVRAHYGFPQSNGCVEMAVSNAQILWPYTPVGTLVTVEGPSSGAGPATTTTTTKPPPPPSTTTAPTAPMPTTTVP